MRRAQTSSNQTKANEAKKAPSDLTVGSYLEFLLPGCSSTVPPSWPPDVFALAASTLQRSGAYTVVLQAWPPTPYPEWLKATARLAVSWRNAAVIDGPPPRSITQWWKRVWKHRTTPLADLSLNTQVCHDLLQLLIVADQASEGVGLPDASAAPEVDRFELRSVRLLKRHGSLCQEISPSRVVVLPKAHTPQTGLTIRSLSHHLALCPASDLTAKWVKVPSRGHARHALNLLVVPWPLEIRPTQFEAADRGDTDLKAMPNNYGCFRYQPEAEPRGFVRWLTKLMDKAAREVGSIDGVVFPEAALTLDAYAAVRKAVLSRDAFLIAGVTGGSKTETQPQPATNEVCFDLPLFRSSRFTSQINLRQHKHHKWRLDHRQIIQYGLGGRLDPNRLWWEDIRLDSRQLYFVAMQPWLTTSVLICEDLARQDPVCDFVRAVGPNLVIALLMDGPQLGGRWAARYATVLADDPGSSVLTVTSLGMSRLSRPPSARSSSSRVVALWKDAKSGDPVQIDMPQDTHAVVLSVAGEYEREWTADGRDDQETTAYVVLAGVHYLASPVD